MATKSSSKSYYQKNKKYREELIKKETAKHKANRPKYSKLVNKSDIKLREWKM